MNSNLCKAHSYSHIGRYVTDIIISFDPRDAADNGLTLEKAQALGLQFCKENFPGHPAIICAHPDGHNGAGNIHVHIVICSVRVREIPRQPLYGKALRLAGGHEAPLHRRDAPVPAGRDYGAMPGS